MPNELGRALLAAEVITPEALADALFHATTRGVALPRALVDVGAVDEARIEEELDRPDGFALSALAHVTPDADLVAALPAGLMDRLYCVPLGREADQVILAVVDPRDPHAADEVAFHLGHLHVTVRSVRATLTAIEGALARLRSMRPSAPELPRSPSSFAPDASRHPLAGWASKHVDLDRATLAYGTAPEEVAALSALAATVDAADGTKHDTDQLPPPLLASGEGDDELGSLDGSERASSNIPILLTMPAAGHANGYSSAHANGRANEHVWSRPDAAPQAIDDGRADRTPPYPFGLDALEAMHELQVQTRAFARLPTPVPLFPEVTSSSFVAAAASLDEEPIPLSRPARSKTPAQLPAFPYPDVGALYSAIREVDDRDRVLDLLIAGVRTVSKRVALFVVRRGELVGWRCSSLFGDETSFRRLRLSTRGSSVLARAVFGDPYIGPMPTQERSRDMPYSAGRNDENAPLTRELPLSGRDVAVFAIRVEAVPALVLLADDLADRFLVKNRLEDFARVSGEALARIARARR